MPFDGVGLVPDASLQKIDAVINLLATPDRWCKGALRSQDGRYCIRGALRTVDATGLLEPPILQAIGEVAGRRFRRIESFNDHPSTSHEQILMVLGRARANIAAAPLARYTIATEAAQKTAPPTWREVLFGWFSA
jgi:hypothetical protein